MATRSHSQRCTNQEGTRALWHHRKERAPMTAWLPRAPMAAPWRALGPEGPAEPRVGDFLTLKCRSISPGERRSCLHHRSTERRADREDGECSPTVLWCSLRSRSWVNRRPRPSWVQSESRSQQLLIVWGLFSVWRGNSGPHVC